MPVTQKNRAPLVVPPEVQRRAGFGAAEKVEFRAQGGVITITAKPPSANDEYTAAQRRAIDARLSQAKAGKRYGPFTADEAEAFLKTELKARRKKSPKAS
jgi:hypothetical protein